ncbi:hypothetical protein PMAYCL1PPCAC_19349, partial [Pristionchus mayeri]
SRWPPSPHLHDRSLPADRLRHGADSDERFSLPESQVLKGDAGDRPRRQPGSPRPSHPPRHPWLKGQPPREEGLLPQELSRPW